MRQRATFAVLAVVLLVALVSGTSASSTSGSATLEGLVDAPKPFKAAQVHLLNVEKNVLFMVYTANGRYRATHLFPGRYEITVKKAGFAADTRTVTVAAGATETVNVTLREAAAVPLRQGEFGFTTQRAGDVALVSYDELYPPEPGRVTFEKTCMYCHGRNFFPTKQYHETQWSHFIDVMTGVAQSERGAMITT